MPVAGLKWLCCNQENKLSVCVMTGLEEDQWASEMAVLLLRQITSFGHLEQRASWCLPAAPFWSLVLQYDIQGKHDLFTISL